MPSPCAIFMPMSRALYSATLLEQGFVRVNARGMTWWWGETKTIPTPAAKSPLGLTLDAPSKTSARPGLSGLFGPNGLLLIHLGYLHRVSQIRVLGSLP